MKVKRGLHDESTKTYQKILELDPSNREALCIIAADQFYNNDPVQSFSYYRRSLQSGTGKSNTGYLEFSLEIFNRYVPK